MEYPAGKECSCSNSVSLKIGPGVTIPENAIVTFTAPSITVDPDFHAEDGSVVNMNQE